MKNISLLESNRVLTALLGYGFMLALTIVSINFWDRPIADAMHAHGYSGTLLKLLSQIPTVLEVIAAIFIIGVLIKRSRERFSSLIINLIATIVLASLLRVSAKMAFGRTWPETWVNDNPSWINDGVEAFHPFAQGVAYNSFPSGHALFTFSLATVLWYHFPRLRPVWLACMLGVFIGQLGQNYHFLGDLLAGATLGTLIAHMVILVSNKARQHFHSQKHKQA
ncbi:phosphatase PAP2 family protein [Shewanella psychropiezotolerans]|uniref:Phosphatase PAP2 family protein n=1 Tax=Shewanella psychropiezotolerans TaxID=2593655 RepID=A0ABX5WV11_9GAMM|nr:MULTISPECIES: phosphatase PAP2 family protein [Shewanella]MPY22793.1 phosphatase PAP2 family protein [Shewanella sp. YLB-07]QDO82931.1 phosphatase PAP2 family protein [Shewanella psychropiezotolerans]